MKTMVKLTVLMATLLLTGAAFAQGVCYDYEYSYTDLDNPEYSLSGLCMQLCFNYGEPFGPFYFFGSDFCEASGILVFFFDSMRKQALMYNTNTTPAPRIGYLKFHGDELHIFNGLFYCAGRFEIRGHKVESCDHGM